MATLEIRPATDPATLAAARALVRAHILDSSTRHDAAAAECVAAALPAPYDGPGGGLWVAWEAGEALGCVALQPLGLDTAELKRLYVRPDARGRGVARRLTAHAIAVARDRRYARLRLGALASAGAAQRLYASHGFRRIPAYRPAEFGDTWFYELPLEPPAAARRGTAQRWLVLAMLVGVALGVRFPDRPGAGFRATDLAALSHLFVRLVQALVAPLLFATLVAGVAGRGDDLRRVGRLALRSLVYFAAVTALALGAALVAVNVIRPGGGVSLPVALGAAARGVEAGARGDVPRAALFAVLFALGAARAPAAARAGVVALCEHVSAVMFRVTALVTRLAPVAVGATVAAAVGRGGGALRPLGALVLTLYGALAAFALVALLPVALAARVPLGRFWREVREPVAIAFGTAASGAALPLALQRLERLGVPRPVAAFVLPAGHAFDVGVTLVILAGALAPLPPEGVALLLAADALVGMARAATGVVGSCLAAVVLARSDGSRAAPG